MKAYIIRHGQTTGDVEDRYGGDYDDHLTKKGKEQAEELAKKLAGKEIETIYHSPRIRAVETAKILANKLKVPKEQIEALRERNAYGILSGLTKHEAKEKHAHEVEKLKKGIHHKVTGSEDYNTLKKRVLHTMEKIVSNKNHNTIAIITHGGFLRCYLREELNLGEAKTMNDCSFLELDTETKKVIKFDGIEMEN